MFHALHYSDFFTSDIYNTPNITIALSHAPFLRNQLTFPLPTEKPFFCRSFENLILVSLDFGKRDDLSSQFKV